ncbi:hypothetical protein DRZ77_02205 [Candidatus Woesearchaeota archaeon]|nr:hypothetical protein [Candidatus Woesearchaeota archaeon]RLE40484.1 MAG: hypothetical protein DRZ77_02205 [Candidatus Woesearchaeota archaeon]
MREFLIFSRTARTGGKINPKNLFQEGRLDIIRDFIIEAFFTANKKRSAIVHCFLYGQPNPPLHLTITSSAPASIDRIKTATLLVDLVSKKKKIKGCEMKKESIIEFLTKASKTKTIYLLDKKGKSIDELKSLPNAIFCFADHLGFPKKEFKRISTISSETISLGKQTYFAYQSLTLLQYFLDKKEFE